MRRLAMTVLKTGEEVLCGTRRFACGRARRRFTRWLDVEGTLGVFGALLAIAWAAGYVVVVELFRREDRGTS